MRRRPPVPPARPAGGEPLELKETRKEQHFTQPRPVLRGHP